MKLEIKKDIDADGYFIPGNPTSKISPAHYQSQSGFQLIDEIGEMPFWQGNAIKYLFRAGKKDGESIADDLMKAKWYINYALEQYKKN